MLIETQSKKSPSPGGATENSPAIHRRVKRPHFPPSPAGTADAPLAHLASGPFLCLGIDVKKRNRCSLSNFRVGIVNRLEQIRNGRSGFLPKLGQRVNSGPAYLNPRIRKASRQRGEDAIGRSQTPQCACGMRRHLHILVLDNFQKDWQCWTALLAPCSERVSEINPDCSVGIVETIRHNWKEDFGLKIACDQDPWCVPRNVPIAIPKALDKHRQGWSGVSSKMLHVSRNSLADYSLLVRQGREERWESVFSEVGQNSSRRGATFASCRLIQQSTKFTNRSFSFGTENLKTKNSPKVTAFWFEPKSPRKMKLLEYWIHSTLQLDLQTRTVPSNPIQQIGNRVRTDFTDGLSSQVGLHRTRWDGEQPSLIAFQPHTQPLPPILRLPLPPENRHQKHNQHNNRNQQQVKSSFLHGPINMVPTPREASNKASPLPPVKSMNRFEFMGNPRSAYFAYLTVYQPALCTFVSLWFNPVRVFRVIRG